MKKIGVIGAGRFGTELAESLAHSGAEVLLLDRDIDTVQRMAPMVSKVVHGDATDTTLLTSAGFADCDIAVVCIGTNMEGSIVTTMNLKELKVPNIVAKAISDIHGKVLKRIGANLVVYPNKERAQRLAKSLLANSLLDYFEISEGVSVAELRAPEAFVGKSLAKANVRTRYGITVLAIKKPVSPDGQRRNIINPDPDAMIESGDILVVFGPEEKIQGIAR